MTSQQDELPIRSFMDSDKIKWRTVKPNFSITDDNYLKNKTRSHKAGSLEKTVENLVKTFEMEASHKLDPADWGTVDPDKFELVVNGIHKFNLDQVIEMGTYKCLLAENPFFDESETQESSHHIFRSAFPTGFAWELLEVLSGPPVVTFTWRHWAFFTGAYKEQPPTGELIELFGVGIATVNDKLQMTKLEIYNDNNPLMMKLTGKCPFLNSDLQK